MTTPVQSVVHSAGIVGQTGVNTPVIGREGLLRLVEWAERLQGGGWGEGGASWPARASSVDGADEGLGEGTVDVVAGGEPERRSEVVEHAPGAVGGVGCADGGGDRG